jgi:hypothetical protein
VAAFAYAANFLSNNVSQFLMGTDGTLTAIGTGTVAAGVNPYSLAEDPSSKYADRTGGKLPGRHHHVALMPRERLNPRFALCASVCAWLLLAAGCANGPPKLKEGLWEIHGQRVENPGDKHSDFTYRLCRDHALDRAADAELKNVKGCNTAIKKVADGKYSSASTCQVAGVTIVSTGSSSYKGDESVHADTHAAYTPAYNGKTEETLTEDQQYVGKCSAAMKPGDRINPADGIIWHHDR